MERTRRDGPLARVRAWPDGSLEQVELGSYPVGGVAGGRGGPGRGRGRLRRGARRLADHDGRRPHRLHAGLHKPDDRPPAGSRQPDHVGDRQDPGGLREGVRPHGRLHPGHDRCAEGARQQQLALPHRRGHDRADPAHAARRRAVHGPVQLSAERDLRDADPGAHHGQHRGVQAAEISASCSSSRCWRRSAAPSRRA